MNVLSPFDMDMSNTSSRLRVKAIEIIGELKRPLAVQEIRNYIRENEPLMWKEIADKCNDYIRVIMSLTKSSLITKYKSNFAVPGIDRRSTFYGLTSETYSPYDWTKVEEHDPDHPQTKKKYQLKLPEIDQPQEPKKTHTLPSNAIAALFVPQEDEPLFIWSRQPLSVEE